MARESSIEKTCRLYTERLGGRLFKWVSPGEAGVADRICVLPKKMYKPHISFIEFKKPKGELSDLQEDHFIEMKSMGCRIYAVDNVQDFKDIIEGFKKKT